MKQLEKIYNLFYETSGVCTDTRKIKKDCLFICLKGDNYNGNEFAENAIKQGAKYVIIDQIEYKVNDNTILVDNALLFLQNLANFHRNKFKIPVIGITGSNGKTSSKELIKAVLAEKFNVLATEGNLNNHIGVPLTLLKIEKSHEIAIIEMGANKFKDIEELSEIARPNFGIITNIGKAHLEGFINFEGVLKTKLELFQSIKKNQGKIIINYNDLNLMNNIPENVDIITYGENEKADIIGKLINLSPFIEMEWKSKNYSSGKISTQMIGKYNFDNFLAAISFGICFGVSAENINKAISEYTPTNNRSQIKKTETNTIILDCYNANPSSMQSALESFAFINNPNKRIIIGDMLELGVESDQEHKNILNLIEKLELEGYTVGSHFSKSKNEKYTNFKSTEEAIKYFTENKMDNTLILLKGSRGIGLEKLENLF